MEWIFSVTVTLAFLCETTFNLPADRTCRAHPSETSKYSIPWFASSVLLLWNLLPRLHYSSKRYDDQRSSLGVCAPRSCRDTDRALAYLPGVTDASLQLINRVIVIPKIFQSTVHASVGVQSTGQANQALLANNWKERCGEALLGGWGVQICTDLELIRSWSYIISMQADSLFVLEHHHAIWFLLRHRGICIRIICFQNDT